MKRLALLGAAAFAACSLSVAQAAEFEWRMQAMMPAGSTAYETFVQFTKDVKEMSGGRLVIEPLPEDAVIASKESLEAVGSGILDGQMGSVGYYAGNDPAFGVLGDFTAGYDNPWQFQMFYELGGGTEIARELYKQYNVHFVGPTFWQAESIVTRPLVDSVDDFKGLKIRAPEGVVGKIFREMGASVVGLPGSEIFQALGTGVIDASDYSTLGQNAQVGLFEAANHAIYPGIHSMPATEISVNLDRWNKLPEDLKAIVEQATRRMAYNMMQRTYVVDAEVAAKLSKEGQVKIVNWSPEERQKLRKIAAKVIADYSKGSKLAQKAYDAHVAFMKKIGLIQQ